MIDRFCYMIFGGLDRMCAAIAKAMEPKPKKKKKKNGKLTVKHIRVCSCADADENRSIINYTGRNGCICIYRVDFEISVVRNFT